MPSHAEQGSGGGSGEPTCCNEKHVRGWVCAQATLRGEEIGMVVRDCGGLVIDGGGGISKGWCLKRRGYVGVEGWIHSAHNNVYIQVM